VEPVYKSGGPVHPLAETFCQAVQGLPLTRLGQCCKNNPNTLALEMCRQSVSGALTAGAVTVTPSAVDACRGAMEKLLTGCSWAGSEGGFAPPECDGALQGTLKQGAVCRSSAECVVGMFCKGAGPTEAGVCAPPQNAGGVCGASVDSMALSARQFSVQHTHPECAGYCEHHLCAPIPQVCTTANPYQCGASAHCVDGKCVTGRMVAKGAPCLGATCEGSLRCLDGVCQEARPEGAACRLHVECMGGCIMKAGASAGVCGPFCGVSGSP